MPPIAVASALIFALACGGGGDDEFPVNVGGGDTPGVITGMPDAAIDARTGGDGGGDGGAQVAGRVCLVTDLRRLTACAMTGADGLTVTVEGATATTAADGAFTIAAPTGTSSDWVITGGALMTSYMRVGAVPQIPAITAARYADLASAIGTSIPSAGSGVLIASLRKAGAALQMGTATSADAIDGTRYDGTTDTDWTGTGTSTGGVAWLPLVQSGDTTLVVRGPAGESATVPVSIEDQAIRFETVAF